MSDDLIAHESLVEALLAFQAEAPTLRKDGDNNHFGSKYTPLDTIVQTINPLLTKHGLIWQTFPCQFPDGEPALRYELTHVPTGQCRGDNVRLLLDKRNSQGLGSALTYMRRYALTAVLNLVADDDDDGNAARVPPPDPPAQAEHKDDARPAAPRIPLDRAQAILQSATKVGMAKLNLDAEPGTPPEFHPVFKAKLAMLGVTLIGELDVDQAEQVEAFLRAEGEGQ